MILPDYGRNPISGRTLEEELEIARAIGGRLPYFAFVSMVKRGIIKPPRRKGKPKCNSGTLSKTKKATEN